MIEFGSPDDMGESLTLHFVIDGPAGPIPGRLWLPKDEAKARPLMLVGHGAGVDKDMSYIAVVAKAAAEKHGFATVAIDAVRHGERKDSPPVPADVVDTDDSPAWWSAWATDLMIADWRRVIDECQERGLVDQRVAYWGLSMGCLYGLPLVAAEPRVQAAVLGLLGLMGATSERLERDAQSILIPVYFLRQLEDEKVPAGLAGNLFDAIGSRTKELHSNPGGHVDVPPNELFSSLAFLAWHMGQLESAT